MCIYPKLIINKKYTNTKKNGGNIPEIKDERVKYVPVGCGKCIECLKKKAREWQVRLYEEIKDDCNAYFVTLTFTDENLKKLCKMVGLNESNAVATKAVRLFLERWRKKYKKSVRHWLITELGHPPHSERIHLHGLIFTDKSEEIIREIWQYGNIFCGTEITNKTINYIMKYVTKIDTDHKNYVPVILCSPGIGKKYIGSNRSKIDRRNDSYRTSQNFKMNLPIYYRNRLFTEEERENLWIKTLNAERRYVMGQKIDVSTAEGEQLYEKLRTQAQEINRRLGYGDDSKEWAKRDYNCTNYMLKKLTDEQFKIKYKELFYKQLADKAKKEELKVLKKLHNK